ncbi:hypothetical protein CCACVL1_06346 [Corchorus capsularis]|uniref:Uncharacterized protein n=1 Tax=Corchorus capsularis TaxID=210143 RepID=A0A1R3JG81_COCAP|nr:hypothetical protein CCACVL1_06346 [Corchorus capsularis]
MQGAEEESREEAPKVQIATLCARAALLLSSLKSTMIRGFEAAINDEIEEKEKMRREIEKLKVELVKERVKMKKIKLFGSMELILPLILVILISSFFMKRALDSFLLDDQSSFCDY